ncbi:integral membrane sensor signal transduction histidine kinase [Edwardsiella piscicida]|nr:integral membrane sensor signal transduction histidine kinase [Edwardsiella piscicida]
MPKNVAPLQIIINNKAAKSGEIAVEIFPVKGIINNKIITALWIIVLDVSLSNNFI